MKVAAFVFNIIFLSALSVNLGAAQSFLPFNLRGNTHAGEVMRSTDRPNGRKSCKVREIRKAESIVI